MTATEVVLAAHTSSELEQVDPSQREAAVTAYLSQARDQLAHAVEMSGPAAVAALKAEIATAAEATKQLGLSREIQTDAQEMVRRAEYALEKAVRTAQEAGLVKTARDGGGLHIPGVRGTLPRSATHEDEKVSVKTFYSGSQERTAIYQLGNATEPEFEQALSEAREDGNLSRANVIRKVQGVRSDRLTPAKRLSKIELMAGAGHTSDQIAKAIGHTASYIRELARNGGIEIAADKVLIGTSQQIDSNRVLAGIVDSVTVPTTSLALVDFSALDRALLGEWKDSLSESIRTLTRLRNRLEKELSNGEV